ncbi:MAG: cupin domain-containing protein [Candidatus Aminicenantes bacterium]|nr:cupin domain-containing protein [Candidatus Aminicenantes bacterium]
MKAIDPRQKLALFAKRWHPHVIAEGDRLQVFLAKIEGEFVMHAHDDADEFFYVVKGPIEMRFRDRAVPVQEGEVILVPRGVEHCPRTEPGQEAHLLVVEPRGTTHTGNVQHERTVKEFSRI